MKQSAGILIFRTTNERVEVLLVHPGGPFWRNKDQNAWSIPKGELDSGESPRDAALREVQEELGISPQGDMTALGDIVQAGGKRVTAFAARGSFDGGEFKSNTVTMEWPLRSGRMAEFPEVDRAEWFALQPARNKIIKGQLPLLDRLEEMLAKDAKTEP